MDGGNDSQKSDEALVLLARTEPEHFGSLVARYEAKLRRYIRRLGVRDEEDQHDVLQEIFIKAYRNLNGFDTALSFSSWVYRIAHNEAVSWYRKLRVRPEGHLVDDGDALIALVHDSADEPAEERFDAGLRKEEIGDALMLLDEKYRSILILRFFEHKEYEEISDILKIPIGTVGTLIHRAKARLRKILMKGKHM